MTFIILRYIYIHRECNPFLGVPKEKLVFSWSPTVDAFDPHDIHLIIWGFPKSWGHPKKIIMQFL